MIVGPRAYRAFRTIHKYAGLTACLWLFVLAVTGVLLDHHEWRWLNQTSVSANWTSKQIGRLVPGTIMRHIAVADGVVLGASERGTWLSRDGGARWSRVRYEGMRGQPQVHGIAEIARQGFSGVYLATDDGLWTMTANGETARRAALADAHLTALTPGHDDRSLIAVIAHSRLVRIDPATGLTSDINVGNSVSGLSPTVPFDRFVMEMHFGRGLLPGVWSVWLNDLGGVALVILSVTGLGYWWVTRRGRRRGMSMKTQRGAIRWLFRAHGPVIGLIAVVPILYLSVTAIPLNHIYGFIGWAEAKSLDRSALPPAYQATSLDHEIDGVAAWPGQPGRISVATRFGVLESRDDGRSWRTDLSLPVPIGAPGANLFRVEDRIFAGFGGSDNFMREAKDAGWRRIKGPSTAITGASRSGQAWFIKNSRAIYRGNGSSTAFAESDIAFRSAASGTPLFLFMADLHAGVIFHEQFKWLNDLFAVLAILLALSGPIVWLRRKWI